MHHWLLSYQIENNRYQTLPVLLLDIYETVLLPISLTPIPIETEKIDEDLANLKISKSIFNKVNKTPIKEVYKITRKIGSGAYGEVRK